MEFLVDPPITIEFLVDPFRQGGGAWGISYRISGEYRARYILANFPIIYSGKKSILAFSFLVLMKLVITSQTESFERCFQSEKIRDRFD